MPLETFFCDFEAPTWFIFADQSGYLTASVIWAHGTALFASLTLAIFILIKNKDGLANRIFFGTLFAFFSWALASLVNTPSNSGDVIMFTWALCILLEPLVYGASAYLLYVLISKQDMPLYGKVTFALFYVPIILLLPTTLTLTGFDTSICLANEGPIALYYIYALETGIVLWIMFFAVQQYMLAIDTQKKQEIFYLTLSIILFLVSFSWGNIVGSFTENWELGSIGLFGAPIFAGFLVYTIVKFGTFNIKILSSVALILTLLALLFVGLFV